MQMCTAAQRDLVNYMAVRGTNRSSTQQCTESLDDVTKAAAE
jgi:hypothetical protein